MSKQNSWGVYALVAASIAVCTVIGLAMRPRFDVVNIAMVYLVAVLFIALRYDYGPTAVTSILAVGSFDYLFIPPEGAFSVDDFQYLLTFSIMLAVGLVVSGLRRSVRRQERAQSELARRGPNAYPTEASRSVLRFLL